MKQFESRYTAANPDTMPPTISLLAIFLCILFGANAVAIKVSFNGVGVFAAAGLRFSIAAVLLMIWSHIRGISLRLLPGQLTQMAIISCIFFCQMSLFYNGQHLTTATHGTVIANILPFIVMLFAHFFLENDRITAKKILGLLFGFSGVIILISGTTESGNSRFEGDLLILSAVILWAVNVTYIKKIIAEYHPLHITLYPMLFTIPLFYSAAAWQGERIIPLLQPSVIVALLYQSCVTASFGFLLWNTLIQKYGATTLHSFIFIMPLSGVACGIFILSEPFTLSLCFAICFVALGLIIITAHKSR